MAKGDGWKWALGIAGGAIVGAYSVRLIDNALQKYAGPKVKKVLNLESDDEDEPQQQHAQMGPAPSPFAPQYQTPFTPIMPATAGFFAPAPGFGYVPQAPMAPTPPMQGSYGQRPVPPEAVDKDEDDDKAEKARAAILDSYNNLDDEDY